MPNPPNTPPPNTNTPPMPDDVYSQVEALAKIHPEYIDIAKAMFNVINGNTQAQQANAGFTLGWYDASEALKIDPPETEYLAGVLKAGDLVCLASESGGGKTYLAIGIGVHVASGLPFAGKKTVQCPVLYVDAESRYKRFKRRLRYVASGAGKQVDLTTLPFAFSISSGLDLNNDEHLAVLGDDIEAKQAGLVFIDTLVATTEGLDENNSKEMEPPLRKLGELASKHNCTIVLLHHLNKKGDHYRGASAIKGASDCMYYLQQNKSTGITTVKVEKNRDGDGDMEFAYKTDFITDPLNGELDSVMFYETIPPKQNNPTTDYVLKFLYDNQEANTDEIVNNAPPNLGFTRQAIYPIVNAGLIQRVNSGGRGAKAIYALTTKGRNHHVSC